MSPFADQPIAALEVFVEARDLDTDERAVTRFETAPPHGLEAERRELERLVATVHPHAKFRSFAGGAATFLDRQHLVVAHYAQRPRGGRSRQRSVEVSRQDGLFAA
jgi:hypothetical protein